MIKNYLKIAWRNLLNQRLFSVINIGGLATGLAVCMMIMMYVAHEMSYDRFNKDAGRIFIPNQTITSGGTMLNVDRMSYAAGDIIQKAQTLVDGRSRMFAYPKPVITYNPTSPQQKFSEKKLLFADANFFDFFNLKLESGQSADVLSRPFSVVLSQDMAKKYFGSENPVGKTIVLKTDSAYTYLVSGVAANSPSNSSITFNFVTSGESLMTMKNTDGYIGNKQDIGFGSFDTFLRLRHAADSAALRQSLNHMAQAGNQGPITTSYKLISLQDVHLLGDGDFAQAKATYLKIFPIIAGLILLLALINYMSLSTAKATLRAKEVGVRKVSGASRNTIAAQFYTESALFTVLAFALGYVLCFVFKPWFLNVLQISIDNTFLYSPLVLSLLAGLLVLTILVAGSYPSFILSAFKPVITLKGKTSKAAGGVVVRKVFTTLQFAVAACLIICGMVIGQQMYFFKHADTGINRDNVVMIPIGKGLSKSYPAFKHEVEAITGISQVSTSNHALFKGHDMFFATGKTKAQNIGLSAMITDKNFISMLGLKWKYAPAINADIASREKILLNETAARDLGFTGNPIGNFIENGSNRMEIAGVLKDFNYGSMKFEIGPLAITILQDTAAYYAKQGCQLFAKIGPHTNLPTVLDNIKSIYKKYDKDTPFDYTFMDDTFNAQYKAEERLSYLFNTFTYITIMLAAMGLFGLVAFTTEQRTKEIGIRKVLGASVASINTLLSRDLLTLVLLAVLIASPMAGWLMHKWLQGFAYRIALSWWMFALTGGIIILTAVLTVSYHVLKAAIASPVKSLRSE